MDGVETIKRIRASADAAVAPVIMLTMHGSKDLLPVAAELGITRFLAKPVSHSSLFDAIMTVFGVEGPFGAPVKAPATAVDLERMRGARVLLVEDNETNQLVAAEILGQRGLEVDVAGNGKEGVDAARKTGSPSPYAIIFLDIQMPVMDGYDAARAIRRLPGYADVPIVALTAEAMEGTREKCVQAGMNDYIAKPLKPAQIYDCLDRWVGKSATPESVIANPATPPSASESGRELSGLVVRLVGLLERDDLGAVGCMDELANHPGATGHEMELGRIAVLIKAFQFERALERLAHFRKLIDPE